MLKLWNWRKKRKKEKINKKIITFFVRNFLHSSVPDKRNQNGTNEIKMGQTEIKMIQTKSKWDK